MKTKNGKTYKSNNKNLGRKNQSNELPLECQRASKQENRMKIKKETSKRRRSSMCCS